MLPTMIQPAGVPNAIARERIEAVARHGAASLAAAHPACTRLLERGRGSMPHGVAMSWFATTYGHQPLYAAEGSGARFQCPDGAKFLDMGLAILSAFAGYAPAAIGEAVRAQLAKGTQFALPGPDDTGLAEALGARWGLPAWQFTLSATLANLEAIRVARAFTGRPRILLFDGKYHGYLDATLHVAGEQGTEPEYLGLAPDAARHTRLVPFNDLGAVERALADRTVAVVLVEPAILNTRTLLPDPGFHAGLRDLASRTGTLLLVDETYTLTCAWGGLTREWGLKPDIVVLGKSLGGGIPLAAWGMTQPLARFFEAPGGRRIEFGDLQFVGEPNAEVATGGTMAANALSIAAGRTMVEQLLTPDAYARTHVLGTRLADGLGLIIEQHHLPWSVVRLYNRGGAWWTPTLPRNAAEQRAGEDPALSDAIRLAMLERGVFVAGGWAHPTVGLAHTEADVDSYLAAYDDVVGSLVAG
jgi:glutamate-1-semialdehyde aminotransferase